MNNPALAELMRVLSDLKKKPPKYEENDAIPELVRVYLKEHPDGLQVIEDVAVGPHINGFVCDIVEALGVIADCASAQGRLSVLKNVLKFSATAAMRDSAMLGLLSFDSPDLYETLHAALQKESNQILRADMESAMRDLRSLG